MFDTRTKRSEDVPDCVSILNHIIALGGSTACEDPFSEAAFSAHDLHDVPARNVVLHAGGLVSFRAAFDIGEGL